MSNLIGDGDKRAFNVKKNDERALNDSNKSMSIGGSLGGFTRFSKKKKLL